MQETVVENKIYYDAPELSNLLGVSLGQSYKIIRTLNSELSGMGYITIAGRIPKAYFKTKYYGFEEK